MITIVAVLSIVVGNVVAIAQTNIKRMLAYSTISHVGFILLGFLAGTSEGYQAALYYTLVYVIMAVGGFGMSSCCRAPASRPTGSTTSAGLKPAAPGSPR